MLKSFLLCHRLSKQAMQSSNLWHSHQLKMLAIKEKITKKYRAQIRFQQWKTQKWSHPSKKKKKLQQQQNCLLWSDEYECRVQGKWWLLFGLQGGRKFAVPNFFTNPRIWTNGNGEVFKNAVTILWVNRVVLIFSSARWRRPEVMRTAGVSELIVMLSEVQFWEKWERDRWEMG